MRDVLRRIMRVSLTIISANLVIRDDSPVLRTWPVWQIDTHLFLC
jgi:hypothetical protein